MLVFREEVGELIEVSPGSLSEDLHWKCEAAANELPSSVGGESIAVIGFDGKVINGTRWLEALEHSSKRGALTVKEYLQSRKKLEEFLKKSGHSKLE
jgi:hypothetical protein